MQKKLSLSEIILIIAASVLPWLPLLFTSFLNDDYQIIGFHRSADIYSLLKPFYTPDISGFYWRPLGNFLHVLTLSITGFSAFAFRFGNLALYTLCCLQLASTSLKIGLSKKAALYTTLLFALLPAHLYMIGWIASKGEFLLTILILLTAQNYLISFDENEGGKKYLLYSLIFFIAALLVKELAFALVFMPAAVFVYRGNYNKRGVIRGIKHTAAVVLVILLYLTARFFVAGGTPFSSPHFKDGSIVNYFKNFVIYLGISFFPPEMAEEVLGGAYTKPILAAVAAGVLFTGAYLYKNRKSLLDGNKMLLWGALWFCVFIAPVLPTLMRWYPFTASIGLVWILFTVIDKLNIGSKTYFITGILLLVLAVYNLSSSYTWFRAGKKMDEIVKQIPAAARAPQNDSILVLGSPDKFKSVPLMKLGVQQTFEYSLNKKTEVFAPLRVELFDINSKIKISSVICNRISLEISNGIFNAEGQRTALLKKDTDYEGEADGIILKIKTATVKNIQSSAAELEIGEKYKNYLWLYFDGEKFERIQRR